MFTHSFLIRLFLLNHWRPSDKLWIKFFVGPSSLLAFALTTHVQVFQVMFLLMIATANTVFQFIYLYISLILHFGLFFVATAYSSVSTAFYAGDDGYLQKANWGQ